MTTGRINQIAVRVFARRHITSSKLMRRRARRKSNPLAGVTKPESQRSSNRERLDGPRSRPSGVGGRKWSPTARAHRLPSRVFLSKQIHANGLGTLCVTNSNRCAPGRRRQRNSVPKSSPRGAHSAVARLQFRREKTQSVAERARIEPKGGRRDSRPAQHACLRRTGDSRIASRSVHSLPAPSHVLSDYTGPEVSCGSCCVVLYWYTSCSSSNLPSSEYAGQDPLCGSPLVSWYV